MFTDRHTAYCWWTDPAQKLTPAHLLSPAALLPCWQGRGTLITLDGTLELRAAWNNWDIQTPSCPRLQMLTWVCGQGWAGQDIMSWIVPSWEWRVESMIHCPRVSTECQFTNIQPQLGPGAGASRMREHFCFHLVSCPAGRYRYCPARTSRCHSFQPAARCNCCNLSNIFLLSPSED